MDVYAPLAHRFGMARIKWELEDLSFKVLQPEHVQEPAPIHYLHNEVRAVASLYSPHTIRLLDWGGVDEEGSGDLPFLVMEWLEGESVNALLRRTSGERVDPGVVGGLQVHTAPGLNPGAGPDEGVGAGVQGADGQGAVA